MELVFEKLTEEHASLLLPIWQDSDVTKYTYIRNIHSIDDAKVKIRRYLNYPHGLLGPFVVKKNHELIGLAAGMTPENKPQHTEIFFHIAKKFWRKGYGSKAIDFLLTEGFNKNNINKIYAQAVSTNIASWKLLEKKGFQHKTLKEKAFDNKMNVYSYFMTKEEFYIL